LAYGTEAGVYQHAEVFKVLMERRSQGLDCLMYRLQADQPLECTELTTIMIPLDQAIFFGIVHRSSFARSLSYFPVRIGSDNPLPEFRLSSATSAQLKTINTTIIRSDNGSLKVATSNPSNPPIILMEIPSKVDMSKCLALSLSATISAEGSDIAQFFYLPTGASVYSQSNSQAESFSSHGEFVIVNFLVFSKEGFSNQFRFDPVLIDQTSVLGDLEVRCRLRHGSSAGQKWNLK
jgi:hypothetical protein